MSKPVTVALDDLAKKVPAEHLKAAFLEAIDSINDMEADIVLRNTVHRAAYIALDERSQRKEVEET